MPDRNAGQHRDDGRRHRDTGRRTILRRRTFRHVHVDVAAVEQRRLDAVVDRSRADVGRSSRNRLLHHVAQVARHRHAALAGHHDAFNGQQLAAHLGPRQTGHNTDLVLAVDLAVAILRHTEELLDNGRSHLHRLLLRDHEFLHTLAGQCRNLTLEVTHARFAGVAADQEQQRVVVDRPFLRVQAVLGDRGRDEMLAGNLNLFVLGVAGDADDLHAVHQRSGNIERIRGRDEHHVGEVVIHLEVVIVERAVLLGVEDLKQSRRRIAAEIGAHLVDLVQQEQRVRGLRLAHRLDDLAGHRADVGAAVSADFRFIPHAAQRHAHELTSGRLRDRLAKRGLADARRADEAQDRSGQLVGAGLHGEILDDAVLDLLKPVVIRVEHFLRGNEVLLDLGLLAPWNRQQPVEIVAHDRRLGGHRRHLPQLLQFMRRLLASFLRELGLVDLLFKIGELVATFVVAEFLLDRLHLLVEVVLALGLLHLALDARADLLLDLQHRDLALHQAHHLLKALGDGQRFQDSLAIGDLDGEMRRHGVRELREIRDLLNDPHHFGGNLLV